MNEKNNNLTPEEEIMREELKRRESENINKENQNLQKSETAPLGVVKPKIRTNYSSHQASEEELKEMYSHHRGIELNMEKLPSKGKFYPIGTKIYIRSAKTSEIKDFSLMDEQNPLDVNDKLNNILSSCVTFTVDNKIGSYKDILEDDKMFVILSIRELTFPKGESKLTMKAVCDNCDHENHFELRTEHLDYYEEHEKIKKYYSPQERCYIIDTKSIGKIILSPPKVGVMQEITNYAKTKQEKREKWDKAAIQILPYLNLDWRGLNERFIFDKLVEMNGWTEKKYSLILRLTEWLKTGIKPTLKYRCEKCYNLVDVELRIEDGMKSLFVRTESDLLDELQ